MHQRLSFWMVLFAFVGASTLWAQTPTAQAPATSPASMPPGQIFAKMVMGEVSMVLNGTTTKLHDGDAVAPTATVITANDSSVILLFSNGASTQLGPDTKLTIEEFLQDPFSQTLSAATMTEEPTRSHTKLNLSKGELVGKVAHLKHEQGSYFTVETPVGAAGIRGTTFRIVFRPTGTGQAFAVFSLSTVEGNVNFQQGGSNVGTPQGGQGQGGGQQGQGNQGGTQGSPSGQGGGVGQGSGGTGGGVAVGGGQEVVVTISVNVNPQTGAVTLTAPPIITSTQPINTTTQQQIIQVAQNIVTQQQQQTFVPTPPSNPPTGGASNKQDDGQKKQGDSSSTSSTTPTDNNGSNNQPPLSNTPTSPGFTNPTSTLTPGAGQGGG